VKNMTLTKAQVIVAEVVAGRKRLGRQFVPRQIMDDVLDALVVVYDNSNPDALSKEDVTKLKRQLAACMNREKARQNKGLDTGNENDSPEDGENQSAQLPLSVGESTSEG
jgi:CO dehydrogenase nickel-insertion accessory protein CooC1